MNISIESWIRRMVRALVIAALLFLGWGVAPVNAAVYQVTTTASPAATMRYICEDPNNLTSGYYAISTAQELQTLASIVNKTVTPAGVTVMLDTGDAVAFPAPANLSTNVKLTSDIDLSGVCGNGTGNWTPIGSEYNKSYTGTFDGQGYTVNHLYISAATDNLGLFGVVTNATIKNLTVDGSISVTSSTSYIGGIVGRMWSDSAIVENCCSQVTLSGSLQDAGGIAGEAKGTIKNCRNQGVIMGTSSTNGTIGGIVGWIENAAVIDCENSAAITGSTRVGGIAGACSVTGSITNAANTADVTAIGTGVGGICAHSLGSTKISNCRNTGNLKEGGSPSSSSASSLFGSYAGGIVGYAYNNNYYVNNPTIVSNCYTTGSIEANTTGAATTANIGLVGKIGVDTSGSNPDKGVVAVSACYWLDSLTLTNYGAPAGQKAVGSDIASEPTITVTVCSPFKVEQGQAAMGSLLTPAINVETGKYALADALNVGLTGNSTYSSWTVDPLKNSGYPIFESDGYKTVSPPTISAQPTDLTPNPGADYTLSLTATGNNLSYQWYRLETNSANLGGTVIATATSASFTTSQTALGDYYYCLVTATNPNGITATTRSNTVTVTVKPEASWVLSGSTQASGTLAEAVAACNGDITGGTITLLKNLTLIAPIAISKDITLLSEGINQITRGSGLTGSDMFTVTDVGKLTLGKTSGMDGNTLTLNGGAVWSGTVDPILGRGTTNTGIATSGSVINNQGVLTMHSGVTIENNAGNGTAASSPAAIINHAVAADKPAKFTMAGGDITGNYGWEAGAIFNNSSTVTDLIDITILSISGGKIYGNQNAFDYVIGAGGIENNATFTLSGNAVISANKGYFSGGVDAGLKMTMTGGTITGNQGIYCGGMGQWTASVNQLELTGGTITGNNATGLITDRIAGGIFPSHALDRTFNISGNPVVTGNTVGGTISYANGSYTASGGTLSNVGLLNTDSYKKPLVVTGVLTSGAAIGLSLLTDAGSTNVVPTPGSPVSVAVPGAAVTDTSPYLAYFLSDNSSYDMAKDGNNLVLKVKTPVDISGSITSREYNGQPIVLAAEPVIKKAGTADLVTIAKENLTYLYTSTDSNGYNSAAAPTSAGAYQLVISVPDTNTDYTGSSAIPFTISKKPVTVTAQNCTISVGADAPGYQAIAPGLVSGETLANVTFNCTYVKNDAINGIAGTYPITPVGGSISSNANYTITYVPGALTVSPASGGGYTPPSMPGVVVTPHNITYDATGKPTVDITGAPAGSIVYYSTDGINYTTTLPAMTQAGNYTVYIKITCPNYADYITTTPVTVNKAVTLPIPDVFNRFNPNQMSGSPGTNISEFLPAGCGATTFGVGIVNDPHGILSGPPTISGSGVLHYQLRPSAPVSDIADAVLTNGTTDVIATENTALTATIPVLVTMANYKDTTINIVVELSDQVHQLTVSGGSGSGGYEAGNPVTITAGEPTAGQRFVNWTVDSGDIILADPTSKTTTLTMPGTDAKVIANYAENDSAVGIRYQTHIQDIGWETDWKTDGVLSGTSGQSKRLEALKVELTGDVPVGATIETSVHVQNYGNLGPFAMGTAAGTSGLSLRLENICLTMNNLPGYSLRYNVHVQNQGWLRDENDSSNWFKSGETAGTAGLSLRLEGILIKLVKDE